MDKAHEDQSSSTDDDFVVLKHVKVASTCSKPKPISTSAHIPRKKQGKLHACPPCNYSTTNSGGWTMHKKSMKHKLMTGNCETQAGNFQCPEINCPFAGNEMEVLHLHLKAIHGRNIESEQLHFASEEEFNAWRNELQAKDSIKFFKSSGTKGKHRFHFCHRSGHFTPKGQNIRHLKKRGSVKCGKTCPARIHVVQSAEGLTVNYCKTHIGHTIDLGKVGLTSPQKRNLAAALKEGVPKCKVIQSVRAKNMEKITPISLLTNQDLRNIEVKLGIGKDIKLHTNDAHSIHLKYNQLRESGDDGVFFYKPYGEISVDYPNLKAEDFVLAYMNNGQEHMLKTRGQEMICMGPTVMGYEMTSIMTLNDAFEGFPVIFFFHSSKSEETYVSLFEALKARVGIISTKTFMSDDETAFFNAWSAVMGHPEKKLLCTWHVLRNWNKKLCGMRVEARNALYEKLYAVLIELNKVDFEVASKNLINEIEYHVEYAKLLTYFSNYWTRKEQWAYCYQTHAGINTNMRLERMHKEIKYAYLKAKKTKRLDVGFSAVLEYLRDLQHGRIVAEYRGKLTSKDLSIRRAHKRSLTGNTASIITTEDSWEVPSFTTSSIVYTVKRSAASCSCETRCFKCQACIHSYTCTCVESSIKNNMCKHVHLVCRHLSSLSIQDEADGESSSDDELVIDTTEFNERRHEEIMSHLIDLRPRVSHERQESSYDRATTTAAFDDVRDLATETVDFQVIQEFLAKAKRQILARKESMLSFPVSAAAAKQPSNTNIVRQRTSFPKKKKVTRRKDFRQENAEIMKFLLPLRFQPAEATTTEAAHILASDDVPLGEEIEISIVDFFGK